MSRKQAVVIGLGQFGMSLSRALADRKVEVLSVDVDVDRVRQVSTHVAEAACFDATDADALSRVSPQQRDLCVCAIGDEAKEASIICTALLRQMGARRIVARANDELHARILKLVGAHEVLNPEREFGERVASRLVHANIMGELSLGKGLLLTEVQVTTALAGKTLAELGLPRRYGITVVALRNAKTDAVSQPDPNAALGPDDMLIVVAKEGAVARLVEGM